MTIQNACSNVTGHVPPMSADGQIQINQVDDVLFTHKPDGTTRRFLLPKRAGVSDASFTVRSFDTYVGVASLTASRTIALPPAASYPPGAPLTVADESGACSPTLVLTIAANGPDLVNGVPSVSLNSPYGEAVLISDGVSKWVANLPASGASNAVLYVPQTLTGGQRDQARANVGGALPAQPSSTIGLTVLDYERDQAVTGTTTLTMPTSVAPGWRTGIVANANTVSGLVVLAVPNGHSLDGVSNGSTTLLPFQRARLVLITAGVWATSWIDRSPIIGLASVSPDVASADFNIPVGYARFKIDFSALNLLTDNAYFGFRISDNGSVGLKSGAADYSTQRLFGSNGTTGSDSVSDTYGYFVRNVQLANTLKSLGNYTFYPGAANQAPAMVGTSYFPSTAPSNVVIANAIVYTGNTSGPMARTNLIRFLANIGTFTGNITLRGEP